MERKTTGSPDPDQQNGGIGRTEETQTGRNEKQGDVEDISKVDRQEGEMNNGELGGDFKETENNSGSEK